MSDPINHPSHYADGWSNDAEVIDITENLNFNRGNAIKYLARAGAKNPDTELEDLRKAEWYVKREIARIEAEAEFIAERRHQQLRGAMERTVQRAQPFDPIQVHGSGGGSR